MLHISAKKRIGFIIGSTFPHYQEQIYILRNNMSETSAIIHGGGFYSPRILIKFSYHLYHMYSRWISSLQITWYIYRAQHSG